MIKSVTRPATPRRTTAGFSMVELAMSICVMLILTALAIPSLVRSLRTYQLNSAAASVSDMLKFTRFEAVRKNKQINFLMLANGPGWIVGTDSNNNGALDPTEKQQQIAGYPTLLPDGIAPSPTTISNALGGTAPTTLTPLSGANGTVTFDARGAVRQGINGGLAPNPYVFYVGNASDADSGYRAVVLLPSGSVQVWTWNASQGGAWRRVG